VGPSAEVVMKKLFKEKLKRRTPAEQRKKSRDERVLQHGPSISAQQTKGPDT
jgi:hypothetical protein